MKGFNLDERGVSFVVYALLVLMVLLAVFVRLYVMYRNASIPKAEAEYVRQVKRSFLELQSKIDGLEMGRAEMVDMKMSPSPIPFVPTPKLGNSLQVENRKNVEVPSWDDIGWPEPILVSMVGRILLEAQNLVYPDQQYVYECGAVIMVQDNRSVLISAPDFVSAEKIDSESIQVLVKEIKILNVCPRITSTGIASVRVTIENLYYGPENKRYRRVLICCFTSYKDAWRTYFERKRDEFVAKGYYVKLYELPESLPNGFLLVLGSKSPEGYTYYSCLHKELYVYTR